jgi:hypothetical protein
VATILAKSSFNANFYIIVATVIPVFYVALIVQIPLVATLTEWLLKNFSDLQRRAREFPVEGRWRNVPGRNLMLLWILFNVSTAIAILVLIIGIIGETNSIIALYHQADDTAIRKSCLRAIFALLYATLIVPVFTVSVAYLKFRLRIVPLRTRDTIEKRWRKFIYGEEQTKEKATADDGSEQKQS